MTTPRTGLTGRALAPRVPQIPQTADGAARRPDLASTTGNSKVFTLIELLTVIASLLMFIAPVATRATDILPSAPEAGSVAEHNRNLQWTFTPDPALPNVLILGDSVSIGYTLAVRKLLAGKANVFRPMAFDGKRTANCCGTKLGVQQIDRYLAGQKWAVIHFNWGLHDLKHVSATNPNQNSDNPADPVQATMEEYRRNLEVIVGKLQATGARLIFATTTPVVPGTKNPLRDPDAPARYNAAAVSLMKARGIAVDDLFAACEPQLQKLQLPHNVHFNAAGYQLLSKQVAAAIAQELPAPRKASE